MAKTLFLKTRPKEEKVCKETKHFWTVEVFKATKEALADRKEAPNKQFVPLSFRVLRRMQQEYKNNIRHYRKCINCSTIQIIEGIQNSLVAAA